MSDSDHDGCSSPQPRRPIRSHSHGGSDDHSASKSERLGSCDYERDSSRSREKEQERERGKERDRDRGRDRDRDIDMDRYSERSKDRGRERVWSRGRLGSRNMGRGRSNDKDRGRGRSRDKNRDSHRDRQKDYSERKEQGRDHVDDHYRRREHGSGRHRDYARDKEDKYWRRSRSPTRGRSERRSKSRSRSHSRSKRTTGFDMAPPLSAMLFGSAHNTAEENPGTNPAIPGMFPNMFFGCTPQLGTLPVVPAHAMTQQATRHARRVYVGGLLPTANEQSVAIFFSQVMAAIGGNTAGPGDAVINVYINHEKKFAFVEMRSVEEASNAMALDGVIFEGSSVKVRRPGDYNPSIAAALGPSQPNPNLNLAAVGLSPGSANNGLEGPDRIFVGGVPYYFTEAQVKELLESFGPLRGFDLVKDKETGNSKGYAFCVYEDNSVTDIACAALNGIKMGDKVLTVRRANQNSNQHKAEQENILLHAQQQIALQRLLLQPVPSKVVCLTQVVTVDELKDDEDYEDILEDMRSEGEKFGKLAKVVIPRPKPDSEASPGVGKVFLEYTDVEFATKARAGLNGRKFGGNEVVAVFFQENKFNQCEYDG